ncbi:unnamed protein product [Sphagnum compactum]
MGCQSQVPLEDMSIETMEHILDTNLMGNIHSIKAALPFINSSKSAPASIAIFSSQAGQVLQQELISHNNHLSVVFPPNTDTPGFAEDEKTKPELTKKLSTSSKSLDSMSVARSTLYGLQAGQFSISCNFDGLMLSVMGAGMCPQHSLPLAVLEVMTTGFFHIVAFFVLRGWYDTILSSTA